MNHQPIPDGWADPLYDEDEVAEHEDYHETSAAPKKESFSALATEMEWDNKTQRKVKNCLRAAQQVRHHVSYEAWSTANKIERTMGNYLLFKSLLVESAMLDGYVGNKLQRFLACDIEA